MNMKKYTALALTLVLLLTMFFVGCGCNKKTTTEEQSEVVETMTVDEADMVVKQNEDGNWYAYYGDTLADTYTGVLKGENSDTWYYVKNGMVDFSYNGFASNGNGEWYIKDGIVDFSYNESTDEIVVENGKVVSKNGQEVEAPTTGKVVINKTTASKSTTDGTTAAAVTAAKTTSSTTAKRSNTDPDEPDDVIIIPFRETTTTPEAEKITQADIDSFIAWAKSYAASKGYSWASFNTLAEWGGTSTEYVSKQDLENLKPYVKRDIDDLAEYEPDVTGVLIWFEKQGNGYVEYFGTAG